MPTQLSPQGSVGFDSFRKCMTKNEILCYSIENCDDVQSFNVTLRPAVGYVLVAVATFHLSLLR